MRCAAGVIGAALVAAGAVIGCSSSPDDSKGNSSADTATDASSDAATTVDSSGLVSCDDPREQAYSAGMQQAGASGVFTFKLVSSTPAPPADETNVFVLEVLDSGGQPVTGATITVTPTMPLMSHGTIPVTVSPNADGSYTLQPVYLFMGGLWEIAVHATASSKTDTTSFFFCVAG
jgi:hypothetical protein